MTQQEALNLADQAILQLRRNMDTRAAWLVGGRIALTPLDDAVMARMVRTGADLAGVFGPDIQRDDLAAALLETVNE